MTHPSVEELIACVRTPGHATEVSRHLARCAMCRALFAICAPSAEPPPLALPDVLGPQPVDAALYGDRALLHRGGMGRTFRARDRRVGRDVVIKEMLEPDAYPGDEQRRRMRARFEREAALTARLQHPSIVGVYEVGRWDDDEPFYTMPLVRGRPLAQEIAARPTVRARLGLLGHAIAACEAIAYAHAQGVVHRDIKPENILVGEFGETVVIDWGLAKDLRGDERDVDAGEGAAPVGQLTRLGVGTPAYMPPEQARGEPPDERVDVYALGATLYHVLGGVAPYADARTREVRGKLVDGPPTPLGTLAPEVPHELIAIVDKAMARAPADRFDSAVELADELRRFETGQLTRTYAYSAWEVVRHWLRRRRAWVGAAIAALVVSAIVGGYAVAQISAASRRATASERVARLELERARGAVAGQLARDPQRRLDALIAGIEAVAPAVRAGRAPLPEAAAGLFAALTSGPAAVRLEGHHAGGALGVTPDGGRIVIATPGALRVWRLGGRAPIADHPLDLEQPVRAEVSPGGTRVLVTSQDRRLAVVELASGAVTRLERHVAYSRNAAWIDDERVITTDVRGLVVAWDARTGVSFAEVQLEEGVATVGVVDGRALIGTVSGRLLRWDLAGEPRAIGAHGTELLDIVAHPRGALTLSRDGELQAWSAALDAPVARRGLGGVSAAVLGVSADGARAAVWLHPETVRVVSVPGLEDVGRPLPGSLTRPAYPFSADGAYVLTIPSDAAPVRALRVDTAAVHAAYDGHASRATVARFLPDGLVLTSGRSGVYVWDPGLDALAPHASEVTALDVAEGGDRLVSCALDGVVRVAGVDGGGSHVVARDPSGCLAAALSPDGRWVVAGFANGRVAVVAADGGDPRWLDGHGAAVVGVAIGDEVIVSASTDGTARVWTRAGEPRAELRHDLAVLTAGLRPDGTIVTGTSDGAAHVWTADGAVVHTALAAPAQSEPVGTGAFAGPRGEVLAGGAAGATLWNASGARVADLAGRPASTACSPFSPDGGVALVTGGGSLLVHGADGALRWSAAAHDGAILCVTASADGAALVTAGIDGVVRWWRASDGTPLGEQRGGTSAVYARLAAGGVLVSAYTDGRVRVDPTDVRDALARACAIVARFGEAERVAGACAVLSRREP